MKDDTIILLAGVGLASYFLLRKGKEEVEEAITQAPAQAFEVITLPAQIVTNTIKEVVERVVSIPAKAAEQVKSSTSAGARTQVFSTASPTSYDTIRQTYSESPSILQREIAKSMPTSNPSIIQQTLAIEAKKAEPVLSSLPAYSIVQQMAGTLNTAQKTSTNSSNKVSVSASNISKSLPPPPPTIKAVQAVSKTSSSLNLKKLADEYKKATGFKGLSFK